VVIGLACGIGSWTMAVFVTAFSWVLIYFLDSKKTCSLTLRVNGNADSKPLEHLVHAMLVAHHCRPRGSRLTKGRKRLEFFFNMPADLDCDQLEAELRAKLPKNGDSRISFEVA
jgi:uncharacterized membrane protein YhiD involved in acid resistance